MYGQKGLLRREALMTRYVYRGTSPFVGNNFTLVPGQVVDGTHPGVAFGVKLELIDEPEAVVEELAFEPEEAESDIVISEEFGEE